jgi:formate/nitrite transporter
MNFFTMPEVTANYVRTGVLKTQYSVWKMILLGILAGMAIALAAATSNTAAHDVADAGLSRMISGLLFPFGLGIVILSGAELFTGSCLIPISILEKEAKLSGMVKNWVFVYIGNFTGSIAVAASCAYFKQYNYSDGGLAVYTIKVAASKCALSFPKAVVFGILCNILVCLALLLAFAAKDVAGKILGSFLPVSFFVICGFEHSVANMYYVPAGIFANSIPEYAEKALAAGVDTAGLTWGNFVTGNLLPVTIGNIIGGAAIALLMWYCHLKGKKAK